MPQLAFDGMGTQSGDIGENFHLTYWKGYDAYYTQLPYWDVPVFGGTFYRSPPYYLGWSTPHGRINDAAGYVPPYANEMSITTYPKTVGGQIIWEPGIAWLDYRNGNWDIYYSTPGTDFSITFLPKSQKVVAGKSISYYVTVNRLSGPAAPAYLSGSVHYPQYQSAYAKMSYNVSPITPPFTSILTLQTSNLMPPGNKQLTAAATIGGYRRWVHIPYTVTAPPTLTLNLEPMVVARGNPLIIYGLLSPAPGSSQTIHLFYRYPHKTGSWALATTLATNAAGAYGATATVPMSLTPGDYDLVAFWVNLNDGSYATSPIQFLTIV
jgi:hypothetical protein